MAQRRPLVTMVWAAVLLALALAAEAFISAPHLKLQQALLSQGQQQGSSRMGVRTLMARGPEFGRKQVRLRIKTRRLCVPWCHVGAWHADRMTAIVR